MLSRLPAERRRDFWTKRELREGDWGGLARDLLQAALSPEAAHPLEEGEARFKLQVLRRWG